MSQPIHYVKDSKLFTVVIEEFASLMNGGLNTRPLGLAGGQNWHFGFQKVFQDQEDPILKFTIAYYNNNWYVKSLDIHFGFYIDNQGPSPSYSYQSKSNLETNKRIGTMPLLDEFLDENSGFLENGALKIQVEIRVLAIIDIDDIRRFNFNDPFEGCFTLTHINNKFYLCKTLISHHCEFFADEISEGESEVETPFSCKEDQFNQHQIEVFLQFLHGVPLEIDSLITLSPVIQLAYWLRANNVLEYCSNELKNHTWWYAPIHCLPTNRVERLFTTVKSVEKFRECTRKMEELLYEMKSELLKTIVKKFFSFVAVNDDNDKITVSE